MKEIKLSSGKTAIVDDEDYDTLCLHGWWEDRGYARGCVGDRRRFVFMHRFLLNPKKGDQVDHKNHNKLDNRRSNLRICTSAQNRCNTKPIKGRKFKGTHKQSGSYKAVIKKNGKLIHIGTFPSEVLAAKAYDRTARELHGEFAYTNFQSEREVAA